MRKTLFVLDPRPRQTVEVFPGSRPSAIVAEYETSIETAYRRLPETTRQQTESSGYGAINSFDRSLDAIKERNDGARLAFVAAYSCSRCSGVMSVPGLTTAVQCDRQREAWSCDERELGKVATELGLTLTVDSDGGDTEQARDAVVRAMLARP